MIKAPRIVKEAKLELPLSKSISNRLLIINDLFHGSFNGAVSNADDTQILQSCLAQLDDPLVDRVNAGDAGTAFRFLTALLVTKNRPAILEGSARMHLRTIAQLVDALRNLGASIDYLENDGYPPIQINKSIIKGNKLELNDIQSSQFVSALILVAPIFRDGLKISLKGRIGSLAYIEMTIDLMLEMGFDIKYESNIVEIKKSIPFKNISIESDWSSAAFFYSIAALNKCQLEIKELNSKSIQGDSILPQLYEVFNIVSKFNSTLKIDSSALEKPESIKADFSNHPDLAQSFIICCALKGIKSRITGLRSLRIKESERIADIRLELSRAGITLLELDENTVYLPTQKIGRHKSLTFNSHKDHRLAMSLIPMAFICDEIIIKDADCVSKSFPNFYLELEKIGFSIVKLN